MIKLVNFPYKECEEKHEIELCFDKKCEYLHTDDGGQTYYCNIVLGKLEEKYGKSFGEK